MMEDHPDDENDCNDNYNNQQQEESIEIVPLSTSSSFTSSPPLQVMVDESNKNSITVNTTSSSRQRMRSSRNSRQQQKKQQLSDGSNASSSGGSTASGGCCDDDEEDEVDTGRLEDVPNDSDDDNDTIPSILPPLTLEVYNEYEKDERLKIEYQQAKSSQMKAKQLSVHGHCGGIPYCLWLPLIVLAIAVIVGTIVAVILYDPTGGIIPPSFAPTSSPIPTTTNSSSTLFPSSVPEEE